MQPSRILSQSFSLPEIARPDPSTTGAADGQLVSPAPQNPFAGEEDPPETPTRPRSTSTGSSHSAHPDASFTTQHCNIVISDVLIGPEPAVGKDASFVKPFEIGAELRLFQPVQILCSLLGRQTLQDLERLRSASEDQLPAIEVEAHLSPLSVELHQLTASLVHRSLLPMLRWISGQRRQTKTKPLPAEIAESHSERIMSPALRRAVEARLAVGLPSRFYVELTFADTRVTMTCPETALSKAVDGLISKGRDPAKPPMAELLLWTICELLSETGPGKAGSISIAFSSLGHVMAYQPNIPPSISALLSIGKGESKPAQAMLSAPLLESRTVVKSFCIAMDPTSAIPFSVFIEPLAKQALDESGRLPLTSIARAKFRQTRTEEGKEPHRELSLSITGIRARTRGSQKQLMAIFKALRPPSTVVREMGDGGMPTVRGPGFSLDVELCDADWGHGQLIEEPVPNITVRVIPRSDAAIMLLREQFAAKMARVAAQHAAALGQGESRLQQAQAQIDSVERLLVESRFAQAELRSQQDEHEQQIAKLHIERARLAKENEHLIEETARLYSMLQTKVGDGTVSQFKSIIQSLTLQSVTAAEQREELVQTNAMLLEAAAKAKSKAQQELERFRQQQEDSEKAYTTEIAKLRKELEGKSAEVAKAQEELLERHALTEQLRQMKLDAAEQSVRLTEAMRERDLDRLKLTASATELPTAEQQKQKQQPRPAAAAAGPPPIPTAPHPQRFPPRVPMHSQPGQLESDAARTAKKFVAGIGRLKDKLDRGFDQLGFDQLKPKKAPK